MASDLSAAVSTSTVPSARIIASRSLPAGTMRVTRVFLLDAEIDQDGSLRVAGALHDVGNLGALSARRRGGRALRRADEQAGLRSGVAA